MKGGRFNFRKALLWICGIVIVGLVALIVAPGNIEGIYSSQDSGCGCGHERFMRIHDGNIFLYETGHPPAHWGGSYDDNGDGTVAGLNIFGNPVLFEPKLFFVRTLRTNSGASGWDFRSFPTEEIQDAIRHHNIKKTVVSKSGVKEIEIYDSDMRFIERKPFSKP